MNYVYVYFTKSGEISHIRKIDAESEAQACYQFGYDHDEGELSEPYANFCLNWILQVDKEDGTRVQLHKVTA